jgi:hypothetical protein
MLTRPTREETKILQDDEKFYQEQKIREQAIPEHIKSGESPVAPHSPSSKFSIKNFYIQ